MLSSGYWNYEDVVNAKDAISGWSLNSCIDSGTFSIIECIPYAIDSWVEVKCLDQAIQSDIYKIDKNTSMLERMFGAWFYTFLKIWASAMPCLLFAPLIAFLHYYQINQSDLINIILVWVTKQWNV